MITVVYCTRKTNPEHKEHLIKSSGLHKHIEVIEIINNGESLTKSYNKGLKQAKNNIVVFCHDDLTIETKQWGNKLVKQFEKNPEYGIIGVAGTKYMASSGQWWEDKRKMYGRVKHTHEGKSWLSAYSDDLGLELEEVVIVDGVFFAVDKSRLKTNFNESVEGFHFYDVTICANINGKIATIAKNNGVSLAPIQQPPGFALGDGKWVLKTKDGDVPSQPNMLYKVKDYNFDIIHVYDDNIIEHMNKLYNGITIVNTKFTNGLFTSVQENPLSSSVIELSGDIDAIKKLDINNIVNQYIETL